MEAESVVTGAIRAAEELMKLCDALGQPVAANYFSMGVDVLRAHLELAREGGLPVIEIGHDRGAPGG